MKFEAKKVLEASAHINHLCAMLQSHLTRSYPFSGTRGSQLREDDIFDEMLPGPGVYVDIGASDPVECSNTWMLYKRGWRGLLIEPLITCWPHILRARRGDYLVDSAVRNYTGKTVFRVQGSVSSVIPSWNIAAEAEQIVDCERGEEILDQFPQIRDTCRFCNIDVEGAEKEVIESIDWTRFKPEILCVEYRDYDPEKSGADISGPWKPLLEAAGYEEIDRTALNILFRRKAENAPDQPA